MKKSVLLVLLLTTLVSCSDKVAPESPSIEKVYSVRSWDDVVESGYINFATMNMSTTYFRDRSGNESGFEFDMISKFALEYDLRVNIMVVKSVAEGEELIKEGKADILGADYTQTLSREKLFDFATSYHSVNEVLTCVNQRKLKMMTDISKLDIVIPKGSSFEETLKDLEDNGLKVAYKTVADVNSEILIHDIWKDKGKCTIVDSHTLKVHRRYFPELSEVHKFKKKDKLAWALNKRAKGLQAKLNSWFSKRSNKKKIAALKRKYFEYIKFDRYNLQTYIKRIKDRLPKYVKIFKEAEKETGIHWKLLAAISYQESMWNPKAVSPTGVKGMMMLTNRTAKEVNVKNRLDPRQSIMGGARYLSKVKDQLPSYVNKEDRLWYALASYNVGLGHVKDAMAVAIWKNQDPTRWNHLREVLPLLAHHKYYKRLIYGHARGLEPVLYVSRIKDYYDILSKSYGASSHEEGRDLSSKK